MTRKNTLKKALMYLVVLVGVLFVGFMAFYFSVNNETIALTIKEGDSIYLNVDDVIRLPLEHTDAHRGTEVTVVSSNSDVAYYSESTDTIIANTGGVASFTITTTNTKFGPFKFDILVGDGSVDNPWYVSTALQFAKIGKSVTEGTEWTVYQNYELLNDINLIDVWTPIDVFYGTFSGEGHTISNLRINSALNTVGIFGTLANNAKFENVVLSNVTVTATNATAVGVVAGVNNGFIGKIKLDGTIVSSKESAFVGSVVGKNIYTGSRPTITTVMANVNFRANGTVGGIAGQNIGGIIFNALANVKSLDVYVESELEPLNSQYDEEELPVLNYGGVVGLNSAVVYSSTNAFRQAAIKNVVSRTNASLLLDRSELYADNLGLVAYQDIEIGNEVHTYAVNNVFENVLVQEVDTVNYFVLQNGAVTTSITTLTSSEFTNPDTYTALSSVWSYDTNSRSPIINMGVSYEASRISDPGNKITNTVELINAFATISANLDKEISYTIDATDAENHEFVVDVNDIMEARGITSWIPIGTRAQPYCGKLIVTNGYVVIENLTIESDLTYLGFFGVISGANTEISNFKFRNVSITSTLTNIYAGVLAGSISNGFISNITIDNATILNAKYGGFLSGTIANATIENVLVGENYVDNDVNLIQNTTTYLVNYGGITGVASGTLKHVQVNNATIAQKVNTYSQLGGLVGKLMDNATISHGYNNGLEIKNDGPTGYYGGIVGYMNVKSVVEYSYNMGMVENIIGTEDESYAGGVAGFVAQTAAIKKSFSNTLKFKNKNIGGIAGVNNGTISESYSLGEYTGQNVGGFAYRSTGAIVHCYTRATLISSGNSDKYTVAGLVVDFPSGATMQFVFSSANIQAPYGAQKFAETKSRLRYTDFENWLHNKNAGTLKNFVIINFGDATIQKNFLIWSDYPDDFIVTDETSVMGMGTSNPFTKAEFTNYSPQIWQFIEGQWPELTNVVVAVEE